MDLDEAADELYAVPPEDFATRRDTLVAEARSAGDRTLARQIGKLKKPVLAAALVNAVTRSEPPEVAELIELGTRMRSAQRELRGADLRELSGQRQQLLARLVRLAGAAASRSVTEAVLAQVRATFDAAIADEAAEAAVLSGRLTAALSYSGFGEVDVTDAVAVPRTKRRHLSVVREPASDPGSEQQDEHTEAHRGSAARTEAQAVEERRAEAQRAEQRRAALREAVDEVAAAHAARTSADQTANDARAVLKEARERAATIADRAHELEELLRQARVAVDEASTAERAAQRQSDEAERTAEDAAEVQRAAEEALSALARRD
jgi:hypothetical protein